MPLLLKGTDSLFPFFWLAAVTCIHTGYHLPMLITQWQSIELFMEGRERRGIHSPPSCFVPPCLTSGLGSRDGPMLPRRGCQAPGSSLPEASMNSSLYAQNLVLLREFGSLGPVYTGSNSTEATLYSPQRRNTSCEDFVDNWVQGAMAGRLCLVSLPCGSGAP